MNALSDQSESAARAAFLDHERRLQALEAKFGITPKQQGAATPPTSTGAANTARKEA